MAIQASGAIELIDLQNEFGGVAPISIGEYYRGGAYVPNVTQNNAIPTAGEIQLSDFYGSTASIVVTVTEATVAFTTGYAYGFALSTKIWDQVNNQFSSNAAGGSRSPTTLYGATIEAIYREDYKDTAKTEYFMVVLSGTRAKSFFTSVTPQGGTTLNTSAATHIQNSGSTVWYWADDNLTWDGTGTRTATFI